jgi:hypothetical protein
LERERNSHERELQHLRFVAGGEPLSRLLHDYDGAPQHGGTRRDVSRDRPNAADLLSDEERG